MFRAKKPCAKQYRPRPVSPIGGMGAIVGMHLAAEDNRPIIEADATDLATAYWLSLQIMVSGESREEDWSVVVCSLNVGLILCERGIGAEYEPKFVAALEGAFRARLRAERTDSWRFDGDALAAIREALAIHDEQIKITTKEEMRAALLEVRLRVAEGNVYQQAA